MREENTLITIREVAKRAGVSIATVSRVLNNDKRVKEDTYDRVRSIIDKYDYQPNMLGRNLRRTETKMILVITPSVSYPFHARVMEGIEETAVNNSYNIILCNTKLDSIKEEYYLDLLKTKRADGVIIMSPVLSLDKLHKIAENYAIIQCSEYEEHADISLVTIDNYAAAYEAVNYLLSLGHKRIAMIGYRLKYMHAVNREQGYVNALADAGICVDPALVHHVDFDSAYNSERIGEVVKAFLSLEERPTAIFALSDMLAYCVMHAITQCGLKVPDDISVMGFDDISFSSLISPGLSTISHPKFTMGSAATTLLIQQINGEIDKPQKVFLDYKMVIRDSTAKN